MQQYYKRPGQTDCINGADRTIVADPIGWCLYEKNKVYTIRNAKLIESNENEKVTLDVLEKIKSSTRVQVCCIIIWILLIYYAKDLIKMFLFKMNEKLLIESYPFSYFLFPLGIIC